MAEESLLKDYLDENPSVLSTEQLNEIASEFDMTPEAVKLLARGMSAQRNKVKREQADAESSGFNSPVPAALTSAGYPADRAAYWWSGDAEPPDLDDRSPAISQAHHEDSITYNVSHSIRHIEEAQLAADGLNEDSLADPEVVSALKLLETQKQRVKDLLTTDIEKEGSSDAGTYPQPFDLIKSVSLTLSTIKLAASDDLKKSIADKMMWQYGKPGDEQTNLIDSLIYNTAHAAKHIDKALDHSKKLRGDLDDKEIDAETERLHELESEVSEILEDGETDSYEADSEVDDLFSGSSNSSGGPLPANTSRGWRAKWKAPSGGSGVQALGTVDGLDVSPISDTGGKTILPFWKTKKKAKVELEQSSAPISETEAEIHDRINGKWVQPGTENRYSSEIEEL